MSTIQKVKRVSTNIQNVQSTQKASELQKPTDVVKKADVKVQHQANDTVEIRKEAKNVKATSYTPESVKKTGEEFATKRQNKATHNEGVKTQDAIKASVTPKVEGSKIKSSEKTHINTENVQAKQKSDVVHISHEQSNNAQLQSVVHASVVQPVKATIKQAASAYSSQQNASSKTQPKVDKIA
jgi:hypothetical protein